MCTAAGEDDGGVGSVHRVVCTAAGKGHFSFYQSRRDLKAGLRCGATAEIEVGMLQ